MTEKKSVEREVEDAKMGLTGGLCLLAVVLISAGGIIVSLIRAVGAV